MSITSCPIPVAGVCLFFFNDTATTEIYTLSLHDALPISPDLQRDTLSSRQVEGEYREHVRRSEEHTSELQSPMYLVCRLLLAKKKTRRRPGTARASRSARERTDPARRHACQLQHAPPHHADHLPRLPVSAHALFFNDTAPTEIYTLSLHDALPIFIGTIVINSQVNFLSRADLGYDGRN